MPETMFHTVIPLRDDHPTRRWRRSPRHIHQRLAMLWPEDAQDPRVLWRLYPRHLLVRSHTEPAWLARIDLAPKITPILSAQPRVEPYDPRLEDGAVVRFDLLCDPSVSNRYTGPRKSLTDVAVWLGQRAAGWGLQILDGTSILEHPVQRCGEAQGGGKRTHRAVRITGRATCRDAKALHEVLARGIGPGKAFGLGMLVVELEAGP